MPCFPWTELEKFVGANLKTLGTVETFEVLALDDVALWIKPNAGSRKEIYRVAFDRAWHRLREGAVLDLAQLQAIQDKRGSYIAGIFRRLPGMNWETNPVRIWLTPPHGAADPQVDRSYSPPVVGNVRSLRYHRPDCEFIRSTRTNIRVNFESAKVARQRGYKPCRSCDPST